MSAQAIYFIVPGQPVPWARTSTILPKRPGGKVRRIKTKGHRIAQDRFKWLSKPFAPPQPFEGALRVDITFFLERPKSVKKDKRPYPSVKPDKDNLEKLVLDSLEGIFFKNDAQVCDGRIIKIYEDHGGAPRTEIRIEKL